jgi:hypothetical protein
MAKGDLLKVFFQELGIRIDKCKISNHPFLESNRSQLDFLILDKQTNQTIDQDVFSFAGQHIFLFKEFK